jgi:DNA-binding MarR family transcriptional regulator
MENAPSYEGLPIPALMRDARGSYGDASRRALAAIGCDDVPTNGGMVIAELDKSLPDPRPTTVADAVARLRLSEHAASRLIDTLVLRGYLERNVDSADPRRVTVVVTDRGRTADAAIQTAVDAVDADLAQRISPAELHGLRAGLAALAQIRIEAAH